MKKFCLALFVCVLAITLCACENSTQINACAITEITSPGSKNYGIRITFAQDKRIENKEIDVQVMASDKGSLTIWEENNDKKTITFADKDKWYSLTTLIVRGEDKPNTEQFVGFGQALTKTYLFNTEKPINLTFRVVAGEVQPNVQGSGQVLTGTTPISQEFVLKCA